MIRKLRLFSSSPGWTLAVWGSMTLQAFSKWTVSTLLLKAHCSHSKRPFKPSTLKVFRSLMPHFEFCLVIFLLRHGNFPYCYPLPGSSVLNSKRPSIFIDHIFYQDLILKLFLSLHSLSTFSSCSCLWTHPKE